MVDSNIVIESISIEFNRVVSNGVAESSAAVKSRAVELDENAKTVYHNITRREYMIKIIGNKTAADNVYGNMIPPLLYG